jgi:hypothetical protein
MIDYNLSMRAAALILMALIWSGLALLPRQGIENSALLNASGRIVGERILTPTGFERAAVAHGSFAEYLRHLPLKTHGSRVLLFNGQFKTNRVEVAVVDMDIGRLDLQQCADAVIRLRAEYLYSRRMFDQICFHFTNGFLAKYENWRLGERIRVQGNRASWISGSVQDNSYGQFRCFLDKVFTYAGTVSLERELKSVSQQDLAAGDVFIQAGSPGHALIVVDTAFNPQTREKLFLLAQSYMPAQEIHVLQNPENPQLSPWYSDRGSDSLITPEWVFSWKNLHRFPEDIRFSPPAVIK